MASPTPKAVRWIKILLKIQLYAVLALVSITILLAIFQPTGGYTLENGFFEDFGYGFVSRIQGEPYGSRQPVFLEDPGYVTGRFSWLAVIPGLTLLAFNRKKKKLFTAGAILILLSGIANVSLFGVISAITILILRFRKSTKQYFPS